MDWTVWDWIPVGGEIFRICPDWPLGPPNLLYNGYRVFLRIKWPGHGVDHPPLSSTKVKERVELYLYSPFGPSWPVLGWTSPLPLHVYNICSGMIACFFHFRVLLVKVKIILILWSSLQIHPQSFIFLHWPTRLFLYNRNDVYEDLMSLNWSCIFIQNVLVLSSVAPSSMYL